MWMSRKAQGSRSFRVVLGRFVPLLSLGSFGSAGCAATTPAEAPPEAVQEEQPAPAPAEPEESPTVEAPVEESSTEAAEPEGPSPSELVGTLCEEICSKVRKSCSGRAADFCSASCGDYITGAEQCPTEVHAALTCQSTADDFLLCSNIAAESCAPLYRTMTDCRNGGVAPRPWGQKAEEKSDENVPEGFARLEVPQGGFSNLAPSGAKVEKLEGGLFKAVATNGDFKYVIEAVSIENDKKLDAKTLLRSTTNYVGNDCQPKLRLHGRYETQGVVHTRFDTVCKDGTEMHGMMHFWEKNIVAVFAQSATASVKNPNLEPFIFSFELKK